MCTRELLCCGNGYDGFVRRIELMSTVIIRSLLSPLWTHLTSSGTREKEQTTTKSEVVVSKSDSSEALPCCRRRRKLTI